MQIDIRSTDQSEDVLEAAATAMLIPPELTYYFGLYLLPDPSAKLVIRRLQDFESPYISLERTRKVLRANAVHTLTSLSVEVL